MCLYPPRRPARLAVFAEAHFALHRLACPERPSLPRSRGALKAPLEPVRQLRAFSREAAAQPHAIALDRAGDVALEASSEVAAFHAVAAGDQEEFVARRPPRVLHVDVP